MKAVRREGKQREKVVKHKKTPIAAPGRRGQARRGVNTANM